MDVRVLGSGFDSGSTVSFERKGVASTKLVVKSTRFVSGSELVATVSIAADADTVLYDVAVATTTGKKGIGSELFLVTGDPAIALLIPLDASGLSLSSDGAYAAGGYSVYADKACGVHAKIFSTDAASGSGDGIMHTDNPRYKDHRCSWYPRKLSVRFPDGLVETGTVFINVHELENADFAIPLGATVKRAMNIAYGGARCGNLRFRAVGQAGNLPGGDSLLVTRVGSDTWDVATAAAPNNRAYCDNSGDLYELTVRFRIVASRPLP